MKYTDNLRYIRKMLNKNQGDFEEHGFTKGMVQSYESGRNEVRIAYLLLLAELSGFSVDEILKGDISLVYQQQGEGSKVSDGQRPYRIEDSKVGNLQNGRLEQKLLDLEKRLERIESQLNTVG